MGIAGIEHLVPSEMLPASRDKLYFKSLCWNAKRFLNGICWTSGTPTGGAPWEEGEEGE